MSAVSDGWSFTSVSDVSEGWSLTSMSDVSEEWLVECCVRRHFQTEML